MVDVHEEVKTLKNKMDALNQLVFGYLENSENCSDEESVITDPVLKMIYREVSSNLYVVSTVIMDIQKQLNTLENEIKKADTSLNFGESDVTA